MQKSSVWALPVIVLFLRFSCQAESPTVETSLVVDGGQSHELVYRNQGTQVLVSELVWPRSLTVGASVEARWNWDPGMTTVLGLTGLGSPVVDQMTDSDWDIPDNYVPLNLHNNVQSITDSYLLSDWGGYAEQVFHVHSGSLVFSPVVGISYRQLSWESWTPPGGSLQVWTPIDGSTPYAYGLEGLVITYRMNRIVPYAGLEVGQTSPSLAWSLGVRVSPFLVVDDVDFHVPVTVYYDSALGGFDFRPKAEVAFPLNSSLWGGIRISGDWAGGARGETLSVSIHSSSSVTPYNNIAGVAWLDWRAEFFVRQ